MGAGKIMHPLYEGKNFSIASKEVELERTIPREQFISGLCFGQQSYGIDSTSSTLSKNPMQKFNCPTFKTDTSSATKSRSWVGNSSRDSRNSGIQESKLLEVANHSEHWAANW
jgi:DNA repair and recombination protein RAD54B